MRRAVNGLTLWVEDGGAGDPTLLLLHGLGATGEVWRGLIGIVERRWPGRWIASDARGHGRSDHAELYGCGQHAADAAALLAGSTRVIVLGHSMGGLVAIALGTGWFGVEIETVVALGCKVTWSEQDLAGIEQVAKTPARLFPSRADSVQRFLRVSGLEGIVAPESALAASGVAIAQGQHRLAADMRSVIVGGPPMERMLAACGAKVTLACGAKDRLVKIDELRRYGTPAIELPGLGHNAMVEDPEAVWRLLVEASGLPA